MMMDPVFSATASLFVAALLAYSVHHKVVDFPRFVATLQAHDAFGSLAATTAATVVAMESVAAVLCVSFGTGLQWLGGIAAAVLFLVYGLFLAMQLLRGRTAIDCGCMAFGKRAPSITWALPVRNLVLAVIALAMVPPPSQRPLSVADGLVVAAGAIVLGLLYAGFDIALALPSRKAVQS